MKVLIALACLSLMLVGCGGQKKQDPTPAKDTTVVVAKDTVKPADTSKKVVDTAKKAVPRKVVVVKKTDKK